VESSGLMVILQVLQVNMVMIQNYVKNLGKTYKQLHKNHQLVLF